MPDPSNPPDATGQLQRDLLRTLVLGRYVEHWNLPTTRLVFTKPGAEAVEVYGFGREATTDKVARIATVGVALMGSSAESGCELMMVLPLDLGGATFEAVAGFLLDFALYASRPDVGLEEGYVTPETALLPKTWPQTAVLVDKPLGEPEGFSALHFGPRHIDVWWVIPVYASERDIIQKNGVARFDQLAQEADLSLADVRRPPVV